MTLEEIFSPIEKELQAVRRQFQNRFHHIQPHQSHYPIPPERIAPFFTHFLHASGKGLRPALVLFSANLTRPVTPDDAVYQPLLQLATAVEFIHSASLVHDDVLDEAEFRRGQRSLNDKEGNKIAILVGDMLFLQAFSLLTDLNLPDWPVKHEIFQLLCQTMQTMCVGEIFQHHLRLESQTADIDEYLGIITHKTALLMSVCCRCGALLLRPGEEAVQTMTEFGRNFGMAFQLADDTVDQDVLVDKGVNLRPLTHKYIKQAKAQLHSANGNLYAKHLIALCDLLTSK